MLEDNKKQEAIHDVLSVIAPGKNREKERIKFYKLQKRVEKVLKKEAADQELALQKVQKSEVKKKPDMGRSKKTVRR